MKTETTYLRIVNIISEYKEATVEFIALKTNLTLSQVQEAVDKLKKLNIIKDGESDKTFRVSSNNETPSMEAYYSLND